MKEYFKSSVRPSLTFLAEQYLQGNQMPEGVYLANPEDPDGRPFVSTGLGPIRVNNGDWIVCSHGVIVPVSNAEFMQLYKPCQQALPL